MTIIMMVLLPIIANAQNSQAEQYNDKLYIRDGLDTAPILCAQGVGKRQLIASIDLDS